MNWIRLYMHTQNHNFFTTYSDRKTQSKTYLYCISILKMRALDFFCRSFKVWTPVCVGGLGISINDVNIIWRGRGQRFGCIITRHPGFSDFPPSVALSDWWNLMWPYFHAYAGRTLEQKYLITYDSHEKSWRFYQLSLKD